jgi:hypothetical protein
LPPTGAASGAMAGAGVALHRATLSSKTTPEYRAADTCDVGASARCGTPRRIE